MNGIAAVAERRASHKMVHEPIAGHYRLDAPKYTFTQSDIGKKFIRTGPNGLDWSYTLHEATELEIAKVAVKLIAIQSGCLKFEYKNFEGDPHVIKLQTDGKPENWNDGLWVPVEKAAALFKKAILQPHFYQNFVL